MEKDAQDKGYYTYLVKRYIFSLHLNMTSDSAVRTARETILMLPCTLRDGGSDYAVLDALREHGAQSGA